MVQQWGTPCKGKSIIHNACLLTLLPFQGALRRLTYPGRCPGLCAYWAFSPLLSRLLTIQGRGKCRTEGRQGRGEGQSHGVLKKLSVSSESLMIFSVSPCLCVPIKPIPLYLLCYSAVTPLWLRYFNISRYHPKQCHSLCSGNQVWCSHDIASVSCFNVSVFQLKLQPCHTLK